MNRWSLLLCSTLLVGCASQVETPPPGYSSDPLPSSSQVKNNLSLFYQSWQGVPYRFGGATKQGIDCSAFMQMAMSSVYQMHLPRTTEQQSQQGVYVPEELAQYGDLVFFKTGWDQRHVGLYIGNKQFMHASTSKGVIISRIDNPYWASKFWQFRRIHPL